MTPPQAVRAELDRARQAGENFPVAWSRAMAALETAVAHEPKVAAQDWRFAMRNTREAWQAFYEQAAPDSSLGAMALRTADSLAYVAERLPVAA